jgi:hypothetical protein
MRTWGYLLYIAYIRWIQPASSVVDGTCGTKKRLASSVLLHGRKTAQVCNQENKRRPSRISGPANAVTILFHRSLHLQVVAFIRVLYSTSSTVHYYPRIQKEILSENPKRNKVLNLTGTRWWLFLEIDTFVVLRRGEHSLIRQNGNNFESN